MEKVETSFVKIKKGTTHWTFDTALSKLRYSAEWEMFASFTVESIAGSCTFDYCARMNTATALDVLIKKSSPRPGKAYFNIISNSKEQRFLIENWTDENYEFSNVNDDMISNTMEYYYGLEDEFQQCNSVNIIFNTAWFGFHEESSLKLNNFNQNFEDFFSDSSLSDFTVIIGEERMLVHKIILAAQSPVFKGMFNSQMKENCVNEVEIIDIDTDIMKIVLKYLYTHNAEELVDDMEILVKILAAADKYEINSLKNHCQVKLAKKINLDTALDLLLVAGTHNGENLVKSVTKFMVQNKKTIIKAEKFKFMLLKRPELFIEFIDQSIS